MSSYNFVFPIQNGDNYKDKVMKFTQSDTQAILELLRWRRDVRHFKCDPLPEEAIQQMMQSIALAPSVGNSRPWRIVRVKSDVLKNKIIENHGMANQEASQKYSDATKGKYQALKLAGLQEAPLQLAVFTDTDPSAGKGLGRQTMPETLTYSTVIAIHQLWLVARTLNIGVGWVSILNAEALNKTLEVDPNWKLTAYLCIGYPEYNDDTPELVRTGWQQNTEKQWLER
jgi:5,6-dimethylbenzimidazole synthase